MPRHQPPLPIVTTSGPTVTQPQFGHGPGRHRPPADKPGQAGKTVTVKAVCRSDIQGQKGGAGTVCLLFLIIFLLFSISGLQNAPCSSVSSGYCARDLCEDVERVNAWSEFGKVLQTTPIPKNLSIKP